MSTLHILTIVALTMAATSPALAQSSRAEIIADQQAEKAQTVKPEAAGRAEQLVGRLALPGDPEGVYPYFASPFPGGGFAIGVGYQKHLPAGARAGVGVSWTVRNFKLIDGHFGMPLERGQRLRVDVRGRWVDAPAVPFYGIGPESSPFARADFGYRPSSVEGTLSASPVRWLRAAGSFSLLSAGTTNEEDVQARFTGEETPGLGADLAFYVSQASLAIDTRPSPSYAERGTLLRAEWSRFAERHDRPFSFDRSEVEASHLIPLVGGHFVLAFRALATTTDPNDGDTVPFMLQPIIGSGTTVRGFRNRRFQDRHRLLLNGEYRWQASRYLSMAIFRDEGQVQPSRDAFTWRDFDGAWGIGARFHTPVASVLRMELARSHEGWVLVAGATQPF